jgi:hypothetical protein
LQLGTTACRHESRYFVNNALGFHKPTVSCRTSQGFRIGLGPLARISATIWFIVFLKSTPSLAPIQRSQISASISTPVTKKSHYLWLKFGLLFFRRHRVKSFLTVQRLINRTKKGDRLLLGNDFNAVRNQLKYYEKIEKVLLKSSLFPFLFMAI